MRWANGTRTRRGLGIGNDDNAHLSKVGLGADTINVVGCVFAQIAGGAIVVVGIQAKAHHPGGDVALSALTAAQTRMIDQNISIKDNLVHDVGIDYRDFGTPLRKSRQAAEWDSAPALGRSGVSLEIGVTSYPRPDSIP